MPREIKNAFRSFYDESAFLAALLEIDGTLVDVNQIALESTGFKRADVVGRKFWDCGWWNRSDELRATIRQDVLAAAAGTPVRHDVEYYLASGEKRYVDVSISRLRMREDGPYFVAATGADVTERKRAAVALRNAEDTFRLVVERSPFGIYVVDANFKVLLISEGAREIFDQVPAQRRHNFDEAIRTIWAEPFASDVLERFRHTLDTGEAYHAPSVEQPRNVGGQAVGTYDWKIERITLPDGHYAVVCHFYDLSPIREVERHKDEFLAILSHELRNPLAAMTNAVKILELSPSLAPDTHSALQILHRQTHHMTRLINDLLEVRSIGRGEFPLEKDWVALNAVVEMAIESAQSYIEESSHTLTVELPERPVHLHVDPSRVAQIVTNLLINAAKYTDRGGQILLRAALDAQDIEISVTDNGLGIAPEDIARVFEMYVQVDSERARARVGMGLGLSLCKRLAEAHHGTIQAASKGLRQGSKFTLRLPIDHERRGAPRHITTGNQRSRAGGLRVLVVDDNRDSATSMVKLLDFSGHQTRAAFDGDEAVELAREWAPQVIVLDIGLPTMDGYEACRRIRALPDGQDIQILAVTGWGQPEDRLRAEAAGFDHHLVKPINFAALLDLVGQPRQTPLR